MKMYLPKKLPSETLYMYDNENFDPVMYMTKIIFYTLLNHHGMVRQAIIESYL